MIRIQLPIFNGDAACAEVDPDLWFPEMGGSTLKTKRICEGCEIKQPCFQWSLDNAEPAGTWGGVSETQRKRMLRERRAERGEPPITDPSVPAPCPDGCGSMLLPGSLPKHRKGYCAGRVAS